MKHVQIYTARYCTFCTRAKDLLRGKGVPFEEIDVTEDDALRAKLVEMTGGQRTVPQVFIGGQSVGGYADLAKLDRDGRLDALLA